MDLNFQCLFAIDYLSIHANYFPHCKIKTSAYYSMNENEIKARFSYPCLGFRQKDCFLQQLVQLTSDTMLLLATIGLINKVGVGAMMCWWWSR